MIDVVQELVKTNSYDYNIRKAVEEFLELSEVLMKKINKMGEGKEPSNEKIVDEIGDCCIRLKVLKLIFGVEGVKNRVNKKLTQFEGYLIEGKYTGHI